jgi:hypothetical protein
MRRDRMDNIKSKLDAIRAVCEVLFNFTSTHEDRKSGVALGRYRDAEDEFNSLSRTAVPALLDAVERILQYRDRMKIELANEDPELVAVANEALGQCCKIIVDALDGLEVDHE